MAETGADTQLWLSRLQSGDEAALRALLARDLPWVRSYVAMRLGPLLRSRGEADDYVQEAMVEALRYGPRFTTADLDQFRALLARITENVLRDHAVHWQRGKREVARERDLPGDTILALDQPARSVTRPSSAAHRDEERAWIRLGIELLPPDDRAVVRLRDWEQLSFAAIGAELGIAEDAARMRYQRVLPRLARNIDRLRRGDVANVLAEAEVRR